MIRESMVGLMGVVSVALLLGCGTDQDAGNVSHDHPAGESHVHADGTVHVNEDGEAHAHGPHGGCLVEIGEAYRAELVTDDGNHAVTVYLLAADGETPVSADQQTVTLQLFDDGKFVDHTLQASQSEPASAEFSLVDEALCHALEQGGEVRARLRVTVAGEELTGIIEEHEHEGHEGHDQDGASEEHDHPAGDDDKLPHE